MGEFYYNHPLDRMLHDDNIYLLEAMIPYVSYDLKLPLALFVKALEIKQIIYHFSRNENMNDCGLQKDFNDISSILKDVNDVGGFEKNSQLGDISNIYNSMEMFKKMKPVFDMMNSSGTNPGATNSGGMNSGGMNFNPSSLSDILPSILSNTDFSNQQNVSSEPFDFDNFFKEYNENNNINVEENNNE